MRVASMSMRLNPEQYTWIADCARLLKVTPGVFIKRFIQHELEYTPQRELHIVLCSGSRNISIKLEHEYCDILTQAAKAKRSRKSEICLGIIARAMRQELSDSAIEWVVDRVDMRCRGAVGKPRSTMTPEEERAVNMLSFIHAAMNGKFRAEQLAHNGRM